MRAWRRAGALLAAALAGMRPVGVASVDRGQATTEPADRPGLVNARQVFAPGEPVQTGGRTHGAGLMRLSPDGRRVLCIRRQVLPGQPGKPGIEVGRLVLRDLATGKDTVIPVPPSAWEGILLRTVSRNVFSPDGSTLVLAAGAAVGPSGVFQIGQGKMQAVLYRPGEDKVQPIAQTEELVLPQFDRTGKGLIVMTVERTAGRLYRLSLPDLLLTRLTGWGMPLLPCPSADVVPLFFRDRDEGRLRLRLYDIAADRPAADLTVHPSNTLLEEFPACWTADGRWLYYPDWEDPPDGSPRRKVARAFDRQAGKVLTVLDHAFPVGPGPGRSTMVLGLSDAKDAPPGMVLHDAASGRTWPLADGPLRLFHADGSRVLYGRADGAGGWAVLLAEIRAPDGLPAATATASAPASQTTTTPTGTTGPTTEPAPTTQSVMPWETTTTPTGKPGPTTEPAPTVQPAPASAPASRPSVWRILEREFGIEKVIP